MIELENQVFACKGCGARYAEYVNGCVHCWDYNLSREENLKKDTERSVRPLTETRLATKPEANVE